MFRQDWPIVTIITALVWRKLHHGNTEIGANRGFGVRLYARMRFAIVMDT
jgi:hypothetical protein